MEKKKILYVDMDDTICDFIGMRERKIAENPMIQYPQSQYGFFLSLKPIPNALKSLKVLDKLFDMHILTRPSYLNPFSYTEKRVWIEKYLGLKMCQKLIMACDKSLLKGNFLVDDFFWGGFEGELIQFGSEKFPNWKVVTDYLTEKR